VNRTWLNQFGEEYAVPATITGDARFVDSSWGNETCPRFTVAGAGETVSLWVDHPDAAQREVFGERFTVVRNICSFPTGDELNDGVDDCQQSVYEGDDVDAAISAAITTAVAEIPKYPTLADAMLRKMFKL